MPSPPHDLLPDPMHPAARLAMLVGFLLAGGIVGVLIGLPLGTALTGVSYEDWSFQITHGGRSAAWSLALIITQISTGLLMFGAAPLLMLRATLRPAVLAAWARGRFGRPPALGVVGAGLAVLVSAPVYSALVGAWLAIRAALGWQLSPTDAHAESMLAVMHRIDSPTAFVLVVVVLGVVTAITQEITFRAIVQPTISRWAGGRVWIGIGVVALINGVFNEPHLLLAYSSLTVLLGALYAWSGRLWVPIAASFTFTTLDKLLRYLHTHGFTAHDVAAPLPYPWPWWAVAASALATAGLLGWLRRYLPTRAVALDLPPPRLNRPVPLADA